MSTELKQAKAMRPLRRVRLLNASLCVLMACMAILAIVTGSALALAIDLLSVFINAVAVTIQTYVIRKADSRRSRIGQPRFSELPGFLFILLAGAEYRRAAAGILERRARVEIGRELGLDSQTVRGLVRTARPSPSKTRCSYCGKHHYPGY